MYRAGPKEFVNPETLGIETNLPSLRGWMEKFVAGEECPNLATFIPSKVEYTKKKKKRKSR
jgi:hypothetical protein